MSLLEPEISFEAYNPIDLFEVLASDFEWAFQRTCDDELSLNMGGTWCDYHISITWHPDLEAIHLSCVFDVKVAQDKIEQVHSVLALVNERQWLGHFDLWSEDRVLVFRTGLPLQGHAEATREQGETLLQIAIDACERYYPAFQFVLWAGKTAEEAISASMFETAGTA